MGTRHVYPGCDGGNIYPPVLMVVEVKPIAVTPPLVPWPSPFKGGFISKEISAAIYKVFVVGVWMGIAKDWRGTWDDNPQHCVDDEAQGILEGPPTLGLCTDGWVLATLCSEQPVFPPQLFLRSIWFVRVGYVGEETEE